MTKIREVREWSSNSVRAMCIKHEFYTRGDNEAYSKMLNYVNAHKEPTLEDMANVACDIIAHSDYEGEMADMMFNLGNEAITTFYDVEIMWRLHEDTEV